MTRFLTAFAVVLVLVATAITGASVLHGDPETTHPPHVARRDGATYPPPLAAVGGEVPEAVIDWIEGVAYAEWIEGVSRADAERAAERDRVAASSTRATSSSGQSGAGSCAGDAACFLPCTRAHESDTAGGYAAVSPSGTYRGAYQFAQPTWDAAVAGAGHDEYVGVPADQAPPDVQDAAAAHLYAASGNRPWGGRC